MQSPFTKFKDLEIFSRFENKTEAQKLYGKLLIEISFTELKGFMVSESNPNNALVFAVLYDVVSAGTKLKRFDLTKHLEKLFFQAGKSFEGVMTNLKLTDNESKNTILKAFKFNSKYSFLYSKKNIKIYEIHASN